MKIRFALRNRKNGGFPRAKCSLRRGSSGDFFVLLEGEISCGKDADQETSSIAQDPACFSAKSRCYLARLTCCLHAPSAIAG